MLNISNLNICLLNAYTKGYVWKKKRNRKLDAKEKGDWLYELKFEKKRDYASELNSMF